MRRITRTEAIRRLRAVLRPLVESQHSLCETVAEKGVFCGGFARWSDAELRERFPWLAERWPDATRAELVALADRWLRNRTELAQRLPCDLAEPGRGASPCAGWDEFYEAELARFVGELCGERLEVVPDELGVALCGGATHP